MIRWLLVLLLCLPTQAETLQFQGRQRSYLVHAGPNPSAVVLVLHGGLATPRQTMALTGFNRLADSAGFVAVYPEGVARGWADGRLPVPVDDVGFLTELAQRLARQHQVERIYACGISNGACMALRLAVERPDVFDAVAAVAGALPKRVREPARAIPVLLINGTEDPMVPYHGGQMRFRGRPLGALRSSMKTLELFAQAAEANDIVSSREPERAPEDGTRVEMEKATGGKAEVALVRIVGGGHTWPGGPQYLPVKAVGRASRELDATRAIWEFFARN